MQACDAPALNESGIRFVAVTAAALGEGEASFESSEYIRAPWLICRKLFRQIDRLALLLVALRTGSNMAARMAMMAMTTSNSIKVNPPAAFCPFMPAWTMLKAARHAAQRSRRRQWSAS